MSHTDQTTSRYARIPRGVWILGFVSLLMDTSSEMIHALLPLFLANTLGASVATIGLIEGFAEAMASVTKVFSGALSDWIGKRKALAALGYGLSEAFLILRSQHVGLSVALIPMVLVAMNLA